VPRCDCPHSKKGNQCKHIIFVRLTSLLCFGTSALT
jgi:uncharacterized Zn finger protein